MLVFTRTKHGADKVVRALQKAGFAAEAIHGNKSQNQRERVLAAFRDGKLRTLIATDIAARGIDVDGVSHVINYDLPNIPESYVHRIGRTARAGAAGVAISFCDHEEAPFLRDIERLIRMSIPATDRRTGRPPAQRRPSTMPATAITAGQHQGRHQQRGHGGKRPSRRQRTPPARWRQRPSGAPEPERPPGGPPAGRFGGGAKRHRKCYIPAAPERAARQRRPSGTALNPRETTGWRRKNCWSSTAR